MVFSSILSLFVSRRGRRVSTRSERPQNPSLLETKDAESVPLRVVVVEDADHVEQIRVPLLERHVRTELTS